jgi:ADP-ribose pyrophosphatase YjhB (NUDIX family)
MERNWSYTIQEGEHKGVTLWSGRYCAACGIVLCKAYVVNKYGTANEYRWFVLANKRGIGTPDFRGFWNLPCGFIERGESGEQAASREVYEETGVFIFPSDFEMIGVETDPNISNNGNITLRYLTTFTRAELPTIKSGLEAFGGETNEVAEAKWIRLSDIEEYNWAFHHKELIYKIQETLK